MYIPGQRKRSKNESLESIAIRKTKDMSMFGDKGQVLVCSNYLLYFVFFHFLGLVLCSFF